MLERRNSIQELCHGCVVVSHSHNNNKGVTDIQTDVDAKSVVVQADAAVKPEDMLAKLLKVCMIVPVRSLLCWIDRGGGVCAGRPFGSPSSTLLLFRSGVKRPESR